MNDQSQTAASASWPDYLLFFLAVTAFAFVFTMWTISIPVDLGA